MDSIQALTANLSSVIRNKTGGIRWLLTAFISGGHLLLEDVPGTGKTTLAKALAASIDAKFKRIQFTPDLLPSDILGVSIYNQSTQSFSFRPGPVFTQILLADEINRASPRTQSALLEAMAEHQVSIEGDRFAMDDLFFVIATQNPVEFHGTYPLPEAQMDRFAMRFELGYVSREDEISILTDQQTSHPLDMLTSVITPADIHRIRLAANEIFLAENLKGYIVDLVAASREHPSVQMGASPRAGITLMKCSQALALIDGVDFVTPDLIQEIAEPVMGHRLILDPDARFAGIEAKQVVQDILQAVTIPD
jgi:MoxR-like ATPase